MGKVLEASVWISMLPLFTIPGQFQVERLRERGRDHRWVTQGKFYKVKHGYPNEPFAFSFDIFRRYGDYRNVQNVSKNVRVRV